MNIVHLCDCMEFMKGIPDKYYELAIVDPPYGIGVGKMSLGEGGPRTGKQLRNYKKGDWDNTPPNAEYFTSLQRISLNQIVWGANYYPQYLLPSPGWILWDKGQKLSQADGELAYTSIKKPLRIWKQNRVILLHEGTIHPTQKPVALYKWLLKNYAKPNDKIFDSHVGSGSIRIACHDMGFDFEGCEIDKDYWEAQEERYKLHSQQPELFKQKEIQNNFISGELF